MKMPSNDSSVSDAAAIEAFAAAWAGGKQPDLRQYLLPHVPAIAQQTRFVELLRVEISRRLDRNEKLQLDEYLERFTEFRPVLEAEFKQLGCRRGVSEESLGNTKLDIAVPSTSLDLPSQLGSYRLIRVVGEGSFGRVYLAFDTELERQVAIKVSQQQAMPNVVDILDEARTSAALEHPAIVRILHVGQSEGFSFIVSEYVEGGDLKSRMALEPFSQEQAARLVREVAEGLHYAHSKGVVHRDLKPANILLDRDSRPRITDFGLALKYSTFGEGPRFAGTIPYMSPEQARREGHRVDGRSDIFSLGTILYELLTRRRPFRGNATSETLDQIIRVDPWPPRQIDDSISRELERICLKALSKRASDRYTCAQDMADDLHILVEERFNESHAGYASSALTKREMMPSEPVIPKGLRSFDAGDADFYLSLLPGPVDRDGLPEAIRFWKKRIEALESGACFEVGVVYGPSGCGKSSLVRAGLLPKLNDRVVSIYVEATPQTTDQTLLDAIARRLDDVGNDTSLTSSLTRLRSESKYSGNKLLIVVDQFEQWLHGHAPQTRAKFVDAIRQCDGDHVQCLLIVRDDFWLSLSRFMNELEIPILEGTNSLLVDLFDCDHARKILHRFGSAYDRLPLNLHNASREQQRFLNQAVSMLAVNGRVVSVQLTMFFEMMKNKEWVPRTLSQFGGYSAIGVAFLDEHFDSPAASAKHRVHRKAAMRVLESLLPETVTDLKGTMRSRSDLTEVSGYTDEDRRFDELLEILDHDLKLITPTDRSLSDGFSNARRAERYYQLSHDYLVPSLREWLVKQKKTTLRGRAELLLGECKSQWVAKQDRRFLPTLREYLVIQFWTRKRERDDIEKLLLSKAMRFHGCRIGMATAVLAVVLLMFQFVLREHRKDALLDKLVDVGPEQVLATTRELANFRPSERELSTKRNEQVAGLKRLHVDVALLVLKEKYEGEAPFENVLEAILSQHELDDIEYFKLACDALARDVSSVTPRLRVEWQNPANTLQRRFRAACGLLLFGAVGDRDPEPLRTIAEGLVRIGATARVQWQEALEREFDVLRQPLIHIFLNAKSASDRSQAFEILIERFSRDPKVLAELIPEADPTQLKRLLPLTSDRLLAEILHQSLAKRVSDREELYKRISVLEVHDPDHHERLQMLHRQTANIAVVLLALQEDKAWSLLRHPAEQFEEREGYPPGIDTRSEIIRRVAQTEMDVDWLTERFLTLAKKAPGESSVSELRALLLIHGHTAFTDVVKSAVLDLFKSHPDPGVHSAAEWLLNKNEVTLPGLTRNAVNGRWFVNAVGQTFALLDEDTFVMGSPASEGHREDQLVEVFNSDSTKMERRVEDEREETVRPFGIATKEVTVKEYRRLVPGYEPLREEGYSKSDDDPAHYITWIEAGVYCNKLSRECGIPESELSFDEEKKKFDVTKHGYRLPTSAEWEYACRSLVRTARFFGDSDDLLEEYAWYDGNAHKAGFLPVGTFMPNDFGLFDVLGNVTELCTDRVICDGSDFRVFRGGGYVDPARHLRCALVFMEGPKWKAGSLGFRLAFTRQP